MKLKCIVTALMLCLCTVIFATDPWGEPSILSSSMTVMASVNINGNPASAGDVLAAFVTVNNIVQLRGKATVVLIDNVPGCLLQVYTEINGEDISFKVWDESASISYESSQTISSVVNGSIGSYPDNLYAINAEATSITDPWAAPEILTGSIAVLAQVSIQGIPATNGDILAAFVSVNGTEQLRGKQPILINNGIPGALIQIFTETNNEQIIFKVWGLTAQAVFTDPTPLNSIIGGMVGSFPDNFYQINAGGAIQQVPLPSISPGSGLYQSAQNISISCSTPGAVIRYTTNGSNPTETSVLYSTPIVLPVNSTTTIKAKAWNSTMIPSNIASETYVITGTVATPNASPTSGTYTSAQQVALSCATSGAQIRYTLDGSEPTPASTLYSSAIAVSATTTLKAKAWKTDWTPSATLTQNYVITGTVATPTFSPSPGYYQTEQNVIISCATPGATIRYTLDGTVPSASSTLYENPILLNLNSTFNIRARAFLASWAPSPTATAVYYITGVLPTPVASPAGGIYASPQTVTLACAISGSTIRYTINGAEPTATSPSYTQPIAVNNSMMIKAKAFKTNWTVSPTMMENYTITGTVQTPLFSPAGGAYEDSIDVNITCGTPNAEIYYTIDGSEPNQQSTQYSTPIHLVQSATLKARAYLTNWNPSAIAEAVYEISLDATDPVQVPSSTGIQALYPNPFDSNLTIKLNIKGPEQDFQLKVYNLKGECVYTDRGIAKGSFERNWDGKHSNGKKANAGIYLVSFSSGKTHEMRKVILY